MNKKTTDRKNEVHITINVMLVSLSAEMEAWCSDCSKFFTELSPMHLGIPYDLFRKIIADYTKKDLCCPNCKKKPEIEKVIFNADERQQRK